MRSSAAPLTAPLATLLTVLLSALPACDPGKPVPADSRSGTADSRADSAPDSRADSRADSRTDSGTVLPETLAEQCSLVCSRYGDCGCEERCSDWCAMYLDYFICQPEIDALIACAATHPDPCAWNEEAWPDITCAEEIMAFSGCSGNSFFPLPGAPGVCG